MNLIVTALCSEAEPIIEYFRLKKNTASNKFDIFENDRIALVVSGIGKIKSAIATTILSSTYSSPDVTFFNFGFWPRARR